MTFNVLLYNKNHNNSIELTKHFTFTTQVEWKVPTQLSKALEHDYSCHHTSESVF